MGGDWKPLVSTIVIVFLGVIFCTDPTTGFITIKNTIWENMCSKKFKQIQARS